MAITCSTIAIITPRIPIKFQKSKNKITIGTTLVIKTALNNRAPFFITGRVPVDDNKNGHHDREGKHGAVQETKYHQVACSCKFDSNQVNQCLKRYLLLLQTAR